MSMTLAALFMFGAATEPPSPPPPPVWQVDHGENFCSMIHRPRDDAALTVIFRLVPRSGAVDLIFSRADGDERAAPPRNLQIYIDDAVSPDAQNLEAFSYPNPDGAPLTVVRIPQDEVERLLTGHRFSMVSEGETILRVIPPRSARLKEAVQNCEKAVITAWGFDPEQPAAVAMRPERVYDSTEYPIPALQERKGGVVYFLASVQPDGRVAECRILLSSGTSELDEATCRGMQRQGRFEPFEGPLRIHVAATVWRVQ